MSKMMPSESTGQGTVLVDRHENLSFYRVCPDGRTSLILEPNLELLVLGGAELCPLHFSM